MIANVPDQLTQRHTERRAIVESPKSSADARRSIKGVLRQPAGRVIPPSQFRERGLVQDLLALNSAPSTNSRPSPPAPSTEVGPSRNVRPHSVNDPCIYLG